MPSTTLIAYQPGFTGLEPLTWSRIGGLFSQLFYAKAEDQERLSESIIRTGVSENEWGEELSELTAQWKEQEIQMLLESLSTAHPADFVEMLKSRLLSLRSMLQDEEGPAADLSPDSLRAFLVFIHQLPGVRRPNMALTSEGEVYARWKGDNGRLFSLHFISGEKVRFTAFRPNPRYPRLVRRISGVDAADTVLQTADAACSVLEWLRP